jgi:predicted Zn-dependent protease
MRRPLPSLLALGSLALAFPVALALAALQEAATPTLDQARNLAQVGKYEEALDAYRAIASGLKPDDADRLAKAVLGQADVLAATGQRDEAIDLLAKTAQEAGDAADPALLARCAELEMTRGRYDEAQAAVEAALKANPDHLLARFVAAQLKERNGTVTPDDWQWFIDHYNARQDQYAEDAQALILIGQAAEKYNWAKARGEDLAEGLNDVINELYEKAIQADPKCWQGAYLQGRLFLGGYREGDARKELNRALLINPSAVEVIVTLGKADLQGYKLADARRRAEEALEVNPSDTPAYILMADSNISDERFADALEASQKAVELNPKDEDALARLAASRRLLVDPAGAADAEAAALAVNPKPATFYAALGERLADRRKYLDAERAFLQSIAADPERADARIGLGMLYMQIGREAEARDLFAAAFAADPFNVRADNMMKVLKHLETYKPIESANYSVLVLPSQDQLLGKYMSEFLESVHGDLTKRFGFSPPGRTQIEILKDHSWFSGRTTGLPFIPTVGACTGKVVALASPRSTRKPYNWSRVLIHEVAHVITLQQTDFNIPHWFTEALAVESEGTPRPQPWNKMLLERVPNRKRLLNLDTINLGFIRPEQAEDRQMAYCQAQLYAQYMVKTYGPESLPKMLDAYRRGLTTDLALKDALNVEKADFEKGYLEFLDGVVKTINARVENETPISYSQLQQQLAEKPNDADLNARMAYENFSRRDYKAARPFADKALGIQKHHPLASYVKARLLQSIGDDDAALELLRPALDPKAPNERVVDLLAELEMKAGRLDEAEKLYEIAREGDPYHSKWIAGLARVHLRQQKREKLLEDLAMLANNDADDLDVRKTLAEQHLARKDYEQAIKWARECLYIQVYDPTFHVTLADAQLGAGQPAEAVGEYRVALELEPKRPDDIKVKLARALNAAGRGEEARETLDAILKADPEHPEAKVLRDELGGTE